MTTIRQQTYIRSYLANAADRGFKARQQRRAQANPQQAKRKPLGWGAVSVIFSAALVAVWLLGSVMGWPV